MNQNDNDLNEFILPGEFKPLAKRQSCISKAFSYAQGGNVNAQTNPQHNPNSYIDYDIFAKGVAVFLQKLILDDINRHADPNNPFNLNYNYPPTESELYNKFSVDSISTTYVIDILITNSSIPQVSDIYKFLKFLKRKLDFIPPNLILTCIYLKRICDTANITLNLSNYRLLFLVTLIIAQKIWMEPYKKTNEFACIFPDSYNKDQLRLYERDLLTIIYHNTKIQPTEYSNLYQILKDLSKEVDVVNNSDISNSKSVAASINSAYPPSFHSEATNTSIPSKNSVSSDTYRQPNNSSKDFSINTIKSDINSYNNTTRFDNIPSKPINKLNRQLKGDVIDLRKKGLTYDQIKSNGYTIYDFIHSQFQIPDLIDANFTLIDLLNVKKEIEDSNGNIIETNYYTINELKLQGRFKILEFTSLGYELDDLKYAGYLAKDYIASGITIRQLVQNNYTVDDLIRLKFTPLQLHESGINTGDNTLSLPVNFQNKQLIQLPNDAMNKLTINELNEDLKIPTETNAIH
mmetsp:Transcript_19637/g.17829  ORF Transcript_19637/g.17829 Transcript_19637/m.17829 type:complete len:518 (-) Transcript_19637:122-1675(-)